jgi:hypothetical protein
MTHKGVLECHLKLSGEVCDIYCEKDGGWNKTLHFMVLIRKGRTKSMRRNVDTTIANPVI